MCCSKMNGTHAGDAAAVVAAVSDPSSTTALTSVVVCMTIMAISAVAYFAIRCYFEEKRFRATVSLCKCRLPAHQASAELECGTLCTYSEVRLFLFYLHHNCALVFKEVN